MATLTRSNVFRIVSLSLAAGDVVQTIPATFRMYKKQWDRRRLGPICFFYATARYFSLASLIVNVGGIFWTYTPEICKHFYMFPNITALIAGMSVQMVVFIRTYAISGHSKYVQFGLGSVLLLCFPVQIFGIVYHRDEVFKNVRCKGKVLNPGEPDWNIVYYSAHMAWDLIACATATYYLVASSRVQGTVHFSNLMCHVLRDGLLYFVVVFLVNLWVVLEFAHVFSSGAASSLPLAVVLIAVQHLMLSTQKLTYENRLSTEEFSQSIRGGPPRFYNRDRDLELESGVFVVSDTFAARRNKGVGQLWVDRQNGGVERHKS
ncbi:hypothetical protein C8R44DRAFT_853697 [Mycena epipterygia]|nr:hypothetical protein C8R44DRAFT_853697 [Mycena epipterygia]